MVSILSIQGSGSKWHSRYQKFSIHPFKCSSQSFLFKAVVLNYGGITMEYVAPELKQADELESQSFLFKAVVLNSFLRNIVAILFKMLLTIWSQSFLFKAVVLNL
jgi:hypothetical protein